MPIRKPVTELPETVRRILPLPLLDAIRRCGAPRAEEIRLRRGRVCTVSCGAENYPTGIVLQKDELEQLFQTVCGGGMYAHREQINEGYLTLPGGIRVGVCGHAAIADGRIIGVSNITGLVFRIPRELSFCVLPVIDRYFGDTYREIGGIPTGGMLLYAPPGGGKTTLLRQLARGFASPPYYLRTVVVDSREELFCPWEPSGDLNADVLSGYPHGIGIGIAVRSLGAQIVLCDEIGGDEDARAILAVSNCGVPLVATAHAGSLDELLSRPGIRDLHRAGVFSLYAGIRREGENRFSYRFTDRSAVGDKEETPCPC